MRKSGKQGVPYGDALLQIVWNPAEGELLQPAELDPRVQEEHLVRAMARLFIVGPPDIEQRSLVIYEDGEEVDGTLVWQGRGLTAAEILQARILLRRINEP